MLGDIDGLILEGMNSDRAEPALDSTMEKPAQDAVFQIFPEQPDVAYVALMGGVWAIDITLTVDHRHLLAALMVAGTLLVAAMAIGGGSR